MCYIISPCNRKIITPDETARTKINIKNVFVDNGWFFVEIIRNKKEMEEFLDDC